MNDSSCIIGKCLAGNERLHGGRTLAEKYPRRYANPLADYVALVVAHVQAGLPTGDGRPRRRAGA